MLPASDILLAEHIKQSTSSGPPRAARARQVDKDEIHHPPRVGTDASHYTPPDAGWQWRFRKLFGDTQAYMTHNEVAGNIEVEKPGFWRLNGSEHSEIGSELTSDAAIWKDYMEEAKPYDDSMVEHWNGNMDMLLVFAGLFSAVLTAFIIEFYKLLQPDLNRVSVALLADIALSLRCQTNGTACTLPDPIPSVESFRETPSAQWINLLWFTSLTLSLTVSAFALLVKQWAQAYKTGLTGPPHTYVCLRQFRFNGVRHWQMPAIIGSLPLLLYMALIMFLLGLMILLWSIDTLIFDVCMAIVSLLAVAYITTTILPLFYDKCPYNTLATHALRSGLFALTSWAANVLCQYRSAVESSMPYPDTRLQETIVTEATGGQLDAEALAWIVTHSNNETIVQQALRATASLSPCFEGFQTVNNMEMASKILHYMRSCFSEDLHLLPNMGHDFACYLQGLYLILLEGNTTSSISDKLNMLASKGQSIAPLPQIESTFQATEFPIIEALGVYSLFRTQTMEDCIHILRGIVDHELFMAPSTLCLLLKRLCALYVPSPLENNNTTVNTLCVLLYSESFSPTFGFSDRVSRLIVLSLYLFTSKEPTLPQLQDDAIKPHDFDKFLLEGLIAVVACGDHYGLKFPSIQKLLLLLLHFWNTQKQGLICEAYCKHSWVEQGNLLGTLLFVYEDVQSFPDWNELVCFLRLPLSAGFLPTEASEIVIQYIIHSDLIEPTAHALLYATSEYAKHCMNLISSTAWTKLLQALKKGSDEAFQLVGHTLFTLVNQAQKEYMVFEKLQAGSLFKGLKAYLDALEDIGNHSHDIKEYLLSLIVLCPMYKAQILQSGLNISLMRIVSRLPPIWRATIDLDSHPEYEFLLMRLEKCLALD